MPALSFLTSSTSCSRDIGIRSLSMSVMGAVTFCRLIWKSRALRQNPRFARGRRRLPPLRTTERPPAGSDPSAEIQHRWTVDQAGRGEEETQGIKQGKGGSQASPCREGGGKLARGDGQTDGDLDNADQCRAAPHSKHRVHPKQKQAVGHERLNAGGLLRRELVQAKSHKEEHQTVAENRGSDRVQASLRFRREHGASIYVCVAHSCTHIYPLL